MIYIWCHRLCYVLFVYLFLLVNSARLTYTCFRISPLLVITPLYNTVFFFISTFLLTCPLVPGHSTVLLLSTVVIQGVRGILRTGLPSPMRFHTCMVSLRPLTNGASPSTWNQVWCGMAWALSKCEHQSSSFMLEHMFKQRTVACAD